MMFVPHSFVALLACVSAASAAEPSILQNILSGSERSPLYQYPTDLTRNILPIPCHSHNDYWRDVPFYSGLYAGCVSTEADVWLYDDELYVGHDESSLTEYRTLQSLYVDPIMDVLRRQNPKSRFVNEDTKNGVFDAIRSQTLYVFVDFKTDGEKTWPYVYEAFKPLREAGYLTTVKNNKTVVPGPVTVIGTGNTPLSKVAAMEPRDIFYDAPLDALEGTEITGKISPIASCSFTQTVGEVKPNGKETLNSKQLDTLRNHISEAKARGIGVRYWDTPLWPVQKRNAVWRTLIDEGVALLNTDDLKAIQKVF